jgi:hypothetical protein
MDVRSPQRSSLSMEGLPLPAKHIAAGAVKRPKDFRAAVCCGGRGEVCCDAVGGPGVGHAQTALAMGKGDLCGQRSVLMRQAQEGKDCVHPRVLCSLNSVSRMLPWTALRQVCHTPFKAAMEQKKAEASGLERPARIMYLWVYTT